MVNNVLITMSGNKPLDIREENDFYSTPYCATEALLKALPDGTLSKNDPVLEPMCGKGHIVNVLQKHGYNVIASDLIARPNIETGELCDTLDFLALEKFDGNIISNPPYKEALDIVKHAVEIVPDGRFVCMLLRLQFLEGKARAAFFEEYPPKTVYVFSQRIGCSKGGKTTENVGGAQAFCWFVWEKGMFKSEGTKIEWIKEF